MNKLSTKYKILNKRTIRLKKILIFYLLKYFAGILDKSIGAFDL
jgi:hypothetical protein